MLANFHTTWMDIGPVAVPYTVAQASFTSHKLDGTAFTSSKALPCGLGRQRSKAITCAASPLNAPNFSIDDTFLTTTLIETAQNTPESRSVEQSAKGRLEDAEKNLEHVLSKSMTLEDDSPVFEVVDGDVYFSHSTRVTSLKSTSTASAATTRELVSRVPREEMLGHEEELRSSSREARHNAMDANPPPASPLKENVEWDVARDNETLRLFSYNRLNLVLDSMFPHIAPHIVITPAEETWEDEYVPWQNRVDPQWPCYLCVPPLDHSTCRLLVVEPHPRQPLLVAQNDPLPSNVTQDPPVALNTLSPFSSPSIFRHSNYLASHECKDPDEMLAIQKALSKATFFAASDAAHVLRKRYDSQPNVLSDLEPAFTWTDPAEPILIANRRMLGAIVLDSICPFLAPHIIINSPPPQPYQLTENNTTPYTQDAAFGDRLVVEACYTNVINDSEDPEHYSYASSTDSVDNWEDESSYDSNTVDLFESAIDSRPGSPLPETPVDDDDDHYFYFARDDDEESKEDDLAIHPDYQSIYGVSSPVQADLYAEKLKTTSRWMFYIEDDDDELPSLDDW